MTVKWMHISLISGKFLNGSGKIRELFYCLATLLTKNNPVTLSVTEKCTYHSRGIHKKGYLILDKG